MEIMAKPTSTTNAQKELRLYVPSEYQANTAATAAATQGTNGAISPFQREVREWQRIDPDTGALFSGRLEADRWINGPLNSYGKISDSQNISQPNGTQKTQRKQLEVIQSCTAGGAAIQVIRSQTIQTTSSRWSSPSSSATASPSPPSICMKVASSTRASKDKTMKTNKQQQQTHKRTTTNTIKTTTARKLNTSPSNATNSSNTSSHFKVTNGINQFLSHSKIHPSTTTSTSNNNSSSLSAANLANGHNINVKRRNWPYIATENRALEICDNDNDNEHHHDSDYIVDHASSIAGDDDDDHADDDDVSGNSNGNVLSNITAATIYADDENCSNHDNDFHAEHNIDGDDVSRLNRLNKSSSGFTKHSTKFSSHNIKSDLSHDDDAELGQHHHLRHDCFGQMDDGHSSSNSSLNSHSGISCRNTGNQFLLNTAPSWKLSNLMKSSSSISNSSNNSTTATTPTTPTTATMNLNTNTATSSMNTHNSRASKISLHAIVGNNGNTNNNKTGDRTASLTPSPTTATATATVIPTATVTAKTTTRPSWQQPTIFRQNNNLNNHNFNSNSNSNSNPKLNRTVNTSAAVSSHHQSASHLAKMRVGDNNCFGGSSSHSHSHSHSSSNNSSSDESRPYATAATNVAVDLRHRHHQSSPVFHMKLQKNDRLTPTQSQQRHSRVDLESFRHYNNNDNNIINFNNNNNNNNNSHIKRLDINDTYVADTFTSSASNVVADDADVDDDIRSKTRHQRRQQTPTNTNYLMTSLQRSRSISTDDLSTEWDINGDDNEEPAEWRRVSKLRRSFQSSSKPQQPPPASSRRPPDLPTNSVSVSRIRAELESGRRLNTVMKNNHVDLAALSTILDGPGNKSPSSLSTSKSAFLTADSLKEIRGRLKKLSNESLYKEDFLINQQTVAQLPEREQIEIQPSTIRRSVEHSPERYSMGASREQSPRTSPKHTTNSLESRLKYKETNPIEWHMRRKSYGFEKMAPADKSMVRMDASTDSGLGRSGELQNWSPTSDAAVAANRNSTVVHFGENNNRRTSSVTRRYRPQQSYEESENDIDSTLNKRHSIAVDESQYVRDNGKQTTQVHINGFYQAASDKKFVHLSDISATTTSCSQKGQQKRVEFCKTEVHFATESGRVNIVETDSKPPPTNNFRRRRSRSVGPLQSLVKSATAVSSTTSSLAASTAGVALPMKLFGDDSLRGKTIGSTAVAAHRSRLLSSPEPKDSAINVTVTLPDSYGLSESSRSSYASTSGVDTTDYETDEMTSLRGILKNKPAKPKPYVLGENIETPDELWGVQLKPVMETIDGTGRGVKSGSPLLSLSAQQRSVAERVRLVEQLEQQQDDIATALTSNGFSTKINVSMGAANETNDSGVGSAKPWEETGPIRNATQRRPSAQEILLQDLKENQRMLDEGLKSTTLIIKTLRSANEFDEAMRRLSITSIEAETDAENTNTPRNEFDNGTGSLQLDKTSPVASSLMQDSLPRQLSSLAKDPIPVCKQLQRLRLIYDIATASQGEEDSADEEVKSYFRHQFDSDSGGGTQESSSYEDEQLVDNGKNWNRSRAKKTIWRIKVDKCVAGKKPEAMTDLPTSNVMSIKLHSAHAATEPTTAVKMLSPIAKPRSFTKFQETETPLKTPSTGNTTKSASYQPNLPSKESLKIIKDARGARQLREHELSYFGVPLTKFENEQLKTNVTTNFLPKKNLTNRSTPISMTNEDASVNGNQTEYNGNRSNIASTNNNINQYQWQLDNNKPDLLKHSPIVPEIRARVLRPAERKSLKKKSVLKGETDDEHLYENIANEIKPVFKVKDSSLAERYDRKTDLKRDAMILSEMNENADQSLRELSDEAALKDRKRRSLQRRNPKPLETIAEKSIADKVPDARIDIKVARGTFSSEAKKTSRHSTPSPSHVHTRERTSSQSSVESCPRARSRSLSSEKEYDNSKTLLTNPTRSTHVAKPKTPKPLAQLRSSSLDSHRSYHSQYSSGEEQQLRNSFRRGDRSRTKTKRATATNTAASSSLKQDAHKHCEDNASKGLNPESKHSSSTSHSSTRRERVECLKDNSTGAIKYSSTPPHNRRQTNAASSLQRSSPSGGSGRHVKDESRDSQRLKRSSATTASGRSTSEHRGKQKSSSKQTSTRLRREEERNSSTGSPSQRLEREEKEQEKSSRSKAHSNRSTRHQQRHEKSTTTTTITAVSHDKHAAASLSRSKDVKHKSSAAAAAADKTAHSKNAEMQTQSPSQHQHPQSSATSKERSSNDRPHQRTSSSSRREEDPPKHLHGLKSAIIKTTTKLRDKSRSRKEKKN